MKTYYPTIGLEIHAELHTNSKMFCSCKNDADEERANMNVCPVCMAHPGAIPTINKKAVEHVIRVGMALGADIADFTEFDRKNYFYPDIPKGYQISQYKFPIVSGGQLAGVDITRVHLEEDTANSKHDKGDYTLVDYNRAGVPLMELVTEPVIHSAEQAGNFARELQLLFRYLAVSEANMEKGQMRVEANISISDDPARFGTKVEVKNLNSFRSAERAIEFELERMKNLLEEGKGNEIVQETRGWDEVKQRTFSQRSKENAADYRYFPDPDLPKMKLSEAFDMESLRAGLPELPSMKRVRYSEAYGLKDADVELYVIDTTLGAFFESVAKNIENKDTIRTASNYILSDIVGLMKTNDVAKLPDISAFATLMHMIEKGELSSRGAKDILAVLMTDGGDPEILAKEKGLLQQNDEGAIKAIAQNVLDNNASVVEEYKNGKENLLQFLVGRVMKESKGSANPAMASKLLKELIGK